MLPLPSPRQVEVRVLRQVHDRGLVGGGGVLDDQLVLRRQQVGHGRLQRARIALVAVGRRHAPLDADRAVARDLLALPDVLVEPAHAAVEVVRPVVRGELVGLAVERERGAADAVRVAPDHVAEERVRVALVARERVEAERHVGVRSRPVGHADGDDGRSPRDGAHLHPVRVRQRVERDLLAPRGLPERRADGARFGGRRREVRRQRQHGGSDEQRSQGRPSFCPSGRAIQRNDERPARRPRAAGGRARRRGAGGRAPRASARPRRT